MFIYLRSIVSLIAAIRRTRFSNFYVSFGGELVLSKKHHALFDLHDFITNVVNLYRVESAENCEDRTQMSSFPHPNYIN